MPLTVDTTKFTTPNGKAPAQDSDTGNNSAQLVIDVLDKNDY